MVSASIEILDMSKVANFGQKLTHTMQVLIEKLIQTLFQMSESLDCMIIGWNDRVLQE